MSIMTHTKSSPAKLQLGPRDRTGGPRGGGQPEVSKEWSERFATNMPFGSHMPLDTTMHWNWRNPLNIIPALMIVLFVITVVGLVVG